MGATEYVIVAVVAVLVVALGAFAVQGRALTSGTAPPSIAKALRSFSRSGNRKSPVVGTFIMVAVTVVLAAVLFVMVAGFSGR